MQYKHLTTRERERLTEEIIKKLDNISVNPNCPKSRERYREKTTNLVNIARSRYGLEKVFV